LIGLREGYSLDHMMAASKMSLKAVPIVVLSTLMFAMCHSSAVFGQSFTDAVGDTFDSQGNPVVAEPYLDLIRSDVSLLDGNFTVEIQVDGPLPKEPVMPKNTANPSGRPFTISWEMEIGVSTARDFRVALELGDWGYHVTMFDYLIQSWTWDPKGISFSVEKDTVYLFISPDLIVNPESFQYRILVFEYIQPIRLGSMLAGDVAPNEGYYVFPDHHLQIEPGLPKALFETEHANVYYNMGNDARARTVAEGFEYAYSHIAEDFQVRPTEKFTIYVYVRQDDLVEGLIKYSSIPSEVAELFRGSGAPRPIDYVMHVSPSFDWLTIAHELTHTFIEEYSGQVFQSIKWLDEGLADYEGYRWVSKTRYNVTALKWKTSRIEIVYKAFDEKKLFSLKDISTEQQWGDNIAKGYGNLEYSQAYLTVIYLCETYGLNRCKVILKSMQQGATQEEAVKSAFGITMSQLDDRFQNYLQRTRPSPSPSPSQTPLSQAPTSWFQANWLYIVAGIAVLVICGMSLSARLKKVKPQRFAKKDQNLAISDMAVGSLDRRPLETRIRSSRGS